MAWIPVFSLPELLECILGHLPMRDLLHAQRVCRHWNELIQSPTLQKKLFFLPARTGPQPQENQAVDINSLLQEVFPCFIGELFTLDWGNADDEEDDAYEGRIQRAPECGLDSIERQDWYTCETKRRAVLRPEASWRRMFPSHPPPRLRQPMTMGLGCCYSGMYSYLGWLGPEYQPLNQNPGLRMGLLWDIGDFAISWWRIRDREPGDKDRKRSWALELVIDTIHGWPCYYPEATSGPSGFKVVDYDHLIDYKQLYTDYPITKAEAPPLKNGGGGGMIIKLPRTLVDIPSSSSALTFL
ncbi:hypothetical protein BJX61DRAFT_535034 [Aspergillus egyptiacus]|nr:hypothetical protein BJX61DRAFT_535034 [Aspergillus egyptiacus]